MSDDAVIAGIIQREGTKYVNHNADRGGPTRYGITLATLSHWRNRACTADDVRTLERSEAEAIYRSLYLRPFDLLPEPLRTFVIDLGVLRGPRTAILMLQELVDTEPDGWIGTNTLGKIQALGVIVVNNLLVGARLQHITTRIKQEPDQIAFKRGWRARTLAFYVV